LRAVEQRPVTRIFAVVIAVGIDVVIAIAIRGQLAAVSSKLDHAARWL
jgi:hypothetical protein